MFGRRGRDHLSMEPFEYAKPERAPPANRVGLMRGDLAVEPWAVAKYGRLSHTHCTSTYESVGQRDVCHGLTICRWEAVAELIGARAED